MRTVSKASSVLVRCAAMMLLGGCYTWTRQDAPVPDVVAAKPAYIRVWVDSGAAPILLEGPSIRGDTLRGLIEGSAAPGFPLKTFAKPVTAVRRTERFEYNHHRTLAVASLPIVFSVYAIVLVAF